MPHSFGELPLTSFFQRIDRGDYHAVHELEHGTVPLVSCAETNSGIEGFYDIPPDKTYRRIVSISSAGLPLTSFYHPYAVGVKDDVMVCTPKEGISEITLRYVVALLNRMRWRFSFGRKCYSNKVSSIALRVPVTSSGGIDQNAIGRLFHPVGVNDVLPPKNRVGSSPRLTGWEEFPLRHLFTLERGDFHSLADLEPGGEWVVSRTTTDNGTVGRFSPPQEARIFPPGLMTISTVSGTAFVQFTPVLVTDNVVVCVPNEAISWKALLFVAYAWNRTLWRLSYARQVYGGRLGEQIVRLPVATDGQLDYRVMEGFVRNTPYFSVLDVAGGFETPAITSMPFEVGRHRHREDGHVPIGQGTTG